MSVYMNDNVNNSFRKEPDAEKPHVRICEGRTIVRVSVSFGGFCFITGMGVFMLGISILCAVFGVYFAKWMGRLFVWCTRKVTKKGGSRS